MPKKILCHNNRVSSKNAPTAYELKEIHRQLEGYTDDELKQIPVLPQGSRLEQGATYIDIKDWNVKSSPRWVE